MLWNHKNLKQVLFYKFDCMELFRIINLNSRYSFVKMWENQFVKKFEIDAFISYQFVILNEKIMGFDFHMKKLVEVEKFKHEVFAISFFRKQEDVLIISAYNSCSKPH